MAERARLDPARLRSALSGAKGLPIEPIAPLPRLAEEFHPAAVLVPIVLHPRPSLILTERRADMRRHAGEISFPGGRVDDADASLEAAALREAEEETGLPPALVEVVGQLDPIFVGTGYVVTPVVGLLPPGILLSPHEAEVSAIIEAPLDFLTDPANQRLETQEFLGATRSFYVIQFGEHRIWGATARMLVELGKRLR